MSFVRDDELIREAECFFSEIGPETNSYEQSRFVLHEMQYRVIFFLKSFSINRHFCDSEGIVYYILLNYTHFLSNVISKSPSQ